MNDTIRISPGQLSAVLDFRATSALAGCTKVDGDDNGVFIARNWPSLSSGEELLWRVLAWMNGASDLPEPDDLIAGLDTVNLLAVDRARRAA